MRSANPVMSEAALRAGGYAEVGTGEVMTVSGTVNKTVILSVLLLIAAAWVWNAFFSHVSASPLLSPEQRAAELAAAMSAISPWLWGGLIGGLVLALVTVFKKTWSPVTSPVYAILEGLALGGISAFMESVYPGIVVQAVALTIGTLFALLFAYRAGFIKVTERFRGIIVSATGGILLVYLATFVLGFFGVGIPMIHGSGLVGIGFSLVVVVIAALNLLLDFDFIEKASAQGSPKYMEWYGAFGIMVTLVWLYIEILRLLAKLRSR